MTLPIGLHRKANTESFERLMAYADHDVYWPLVSDYRYQMFAGGRGSGKSFNVTEALILWSDVVQDKFLLAREIQNSIADSCHSQMESHIDRLGLTARFDVQKNTIINRATGSQFIYKGLRTNINSVKSLDGIGFCFVEEAQAVSAASWKVLLPTIRKKGSRIIIACNPEEEDSFMQKRWITNPCARTAYQHVNYNQNPYFPQELDDERKYALRLIETAPNDDARIQAQADYDWVWLGQPKRITASQVIRRVEVAEFEAPNGVQFLYGMDFGFSADPNALIRCFEIGDDLFIDYEVVGRVELDEMSELIEKGMPDVRRWKIKGDCSRPETISKLKNSHGYNITGAKKWQGSVEDGLAHLNNYHRIYVHPRCKTVIQETKDYKYKVDKVDGNVLPILIDKHNHTWDAVRYALDGRIAQKGKSFLDMGRK